MVAAALLAACGPAAPPIVTEVTLTIDAENSCALGGKPIECRAAAAAIREAHPGSTPRVDICMHAGTRYEAAVEVMQSLSEAGLETGALDCGKPPA
jgi:biopolymer transport protein ExbD